MKFFDSDVFAVALIVFVVLFVLAHVILYLTKQEVVMRVIVVFEYKGIPADGEQADQIVEVIGKACESMGNEVGAGACFVEDVEWD